MAPDPGTLRHVSSSGLFGFCLLNSSVNAVSSNSGDLHDMEGVIPCTGMSRMQAL